MSFALGLTNRLSQGIDRRIATRESEEAQRRAMQMQMEQERQMLPLELARQRAIANQKLEMRPAQFEREQLELKRVAELKAEIKEIAESKKPKVNRKWAAAILSGQQALEDYFKDPDNPDPTETDVKFLNLVKTALIAIRNNPENRVSVAKQLADIDIAAAEKN
jgi:hypothetical protein